MGVLMSEGAWVTIAVALIGIIAAIIKFVPSNSKQCPLHTGIEVASKNSEKERTEIKQEQIRLAGSIEKTRTEIFDGITDLRSDMNEGFTEQRKEMRAFCETIQIALRTKNGTNG